MATKPDCPFCALVAAYPPSPVPYSPPPAPPTPTSPTAHVILSTPHLLAFLDHAPISRGHVLVVVRAHREKLGDVTTVEGRCLGGWLGVVSRAVMGVVREGDGGDVGDWNVVQNNGSC